MNIIICDDDPLFVEKISSIIKPLIHRLYPTASIFTFSDSSKFLSWKIQLNLNIDLLYIDVQMPKYNGLDIMELLNHKFQCYPYTIFISSYQEYVFKSFNYNPKRYLVKPISQEDIVTLTQELIELYKKDHYILPIISDDKHIALPIHKIICIESCSGKLTYHTLDGDYTTSGKISEIELKLKPYFFLRTHKSFIINMTKVSYYKKHTFYLSNNYIAEISRTRRSSVIKQYQNFIYKQAID